MTQKPGRTWTREEELKWLDDFRKAREPGPSSDVPPVVPPDVGREQPPLGSLAELYAARGVPLPQPTVVRDEGQEPPPPRPMAPSVPTRELPPFGSRAEMEFGLRGGPPTMPTQRMPGPGDVSAKELGRRIGLYPPEGEGFWSPVLGPIEPKVPYAWEDRTTPVATPTPVRGSPTDPLIKNLATLHAVTQELAGRGVNAFQQFVPGTQQLEREFEASRTGLSQYPSGQQALQRADFPSTRINPLEMLLGPQPPPDSPFYGLTSSLYTRGEGPEIPLPGGRSFGNIDLGVQGLLELFFDPINLAFAAKPVAGLAGSLSKIAPPPPSTIATTGRRTAEQVAEIMGDRAGVGAARGRVAVGEVPTRGMAGAGVVPPSRGVGPPVAPGIEAERQAVQAVRAKYRPQLTALHDEAMRLDEAVSQEMAPRVAEAGPGEFVKYDPKLQAPAREAEDALMALQAEARAAEDAVSPTMARFHQLDAERGPLVLTPGKTRSEQLRASRRIENIDRETRSLSPQTDYIQGITNQLPVETAATVPAPPTRGMAGDVAPVAEAVEAVGEVRFASTMSSGGTVEAGLSPGSARSVYANEINPKRVKAFNEAFGTNYTARNIADAPSLQALRQSGAQHYHASPVCKNFTKAKSLRTADPNDLAIARSVARDIREVKPPTVSIENVPRYRDTALFKLITKELDDAGYNWDVNIVNAADYGGAQTRERMILWAVRKDIGELPALPQKTHAFSETGIGADWYPLLKDLIDAEVAVPIRQAFARAPDEIARIRKMFAKKEGDPLRLVPNEPIITMGGSASRGVPSARNAGNVAPTLLATEKAVPRIIIPGPKGFADATVIRVTPAMMRRLMGLPDSYVIPGDPGLAKNILGDGVHGSVTKNFIQPLVDIHQGRRAVTGAAPSPTGGMPGRIGAEVAEEVADVPVAAARVAEGGLPPTQPPVRPVAEGAGAGVPPGGPLPSTTTPRKGNLLQATTAEELTANASTKAKAAATEGTPSYTIKQVLAEARSLDAKRSALANQFHSRAKDGLRDMGRIDNTGHLMDVPGRPSIYDVAENPTVYQLTSRQQQGLEKLGRLLDDIRAERELFGIPPNEIAVLDLGHFFPRVVKKVGDEELLPRGTGTSLRGGGAERGRRVAVGEVAQAEATGTVYASPLESIDAYVGRWLKASQDQHIKSLLVPFSETSSMRIPPALRTQIQALQQQIRSLLQSGIRLAEKQDSALRAFLEASDPDVSALRDVIDKIRISRGQFTGLNYAEAQQTLRAVRTQARELAPAWREAIESAKMPRSGRQTVPADVAPLLAGRDFSADTAKSLLRHYGRGGPPRSQLDEIRSFLRKYVQVPIRFMNATFDFSAFLRQQASAAATHPVAYVRNFFRSFRDVVDSSAYDAMVGSPAGQHAASRGLSIFGSAGEIAEFQAAGWMERIPFIKQANNHFIRFNTRQRLELFHLELRRFSKKLGRELTVQEEEQIARGLNRATGVSTSIGRDFETDLLFASRYTRSTIEEVVKAVSSGDMEGQIARRYMGHLFAATGTMATAAALIQGRPLEEVLNPIDSLALERGELSLNPNFMSIRLYGHDLKPLGVYDSLARLMLVAGDSMVGAITDRDAKRLFDFFIYGISSKGAPIPSLATDIVRDTTFSGEDPLSPGALAKRPLPFTAQNIIESAQRGMPLEQAIPGAIFESGGIKTSPMSFSDHTDEYARKRYGKRYRDLEPYQRDITRDFIELSIETGKIPRRQPADGYWAELDAINERYDEKLQGILTLMREGVPGAYRPRTTPYKISRTSKLSEREVRELYYAAEDAARIERAQAARSHGIAFDDPDPNEEDLNKRALDGYYALFEKATVENNFILTKFISDRSRYEAGLPYAQKQYVYRNTNRRDIPRKIVDNLSDTTQARLRQSDTARARHGQ